MAFFSTINENGNIEDETKTTNKMIKYLIINIQYITTCDYCDSFADAEIVELAGVNRDKNILAGCKSRKG